jgi:hypothetical protein
MKWKCITKLILASAILMSFNACAVDIQPLGYGYGYYSGYDGGPVLYYGAYRGYGYPHRGYHHGR